jgi:hypothetical protein
MAPLLPFHPGGFGNPFWQLVSQDARLVSVPNSRRLHRAPLLTFVSWLGAPRIGYLEEKRQKILCSSASALNRGTTRASRSPPYRPHARQHRVCDVIGRTLWLMQALRDASGRIVQRTTQALAAAANQRHRAGDGALSESMRPSPSRNGPKECASTESRLQPIVEVCCKPDT